MKVTHLKLRAGEFRRMNREAKGVAYVDITWTWSLGLRLLLGVGLAFISLGAWILGIQCKIRRHTQEGGEQKEATDDEP